MVKAAVSVLKAIVRGGRSAWLIGLVASAALLAGWLWPAAAQAQTAVHLASLQISIWPEFDQPSSLVIFDGQLAPDVALPADLSVRMPAAAQKPNAVAITGSDGSLFETPYTTAAAGGDIIIKFTTSSAGFRVEYYDPALVISGDARSYAFRWTSDYAIGAVNLNVQEPYGATQVIGRPALTATGAGLYGLNYDGAALGALPAGGTVSLDLSYQKSDNTLSKTVVGSATTNGNVSGAAAPATSTGSLSWPWLLGGGFVAVVMIGGGAAWYARRQTAEGSRAHARAGRRGRSSARRSAAPARAAGPVKPAGPGAEPTGFCTKCGNRLRAGDEFCRQCGARVRV